MKLENARWQAKRKYEQSRTDSEMKNSQAEKREARTICAAIDTRGAAASVPFENYFYAFMVYAAQSAHMNPGFLPSPPVASWPGTTGPPSCSSNLLPLGRTPNEYWQHWLKQCRPCPALPGQLFDFGLRVLPIFVFVFRIEACACASLSLPKLKVSFSI